MWWQNDFPSWTGRVGGYRPGRGSACQSTTRRWVSLQKPSPATVSSCRIRWLSSREGSVVVDECVLTLRSSQLEVQVLSSRGGRVLSLRNVADDREWLAQRRRDDLESPPALDSVFTDADHCGWDEMFPTVDPCDFPGEPFLGVGVPDHGELWSRPWEVEMATATTLVQHVRSERFGYFFQRTLRLDGGALRC